MNFEKEIHSEFWFPQQIIVYQDLKFKNIKNKFVEYCKKQQKVDIKGRVLSNCLGWQSDSICTDNFVTDYIKENVRESLHTQFNMKVNTNFHIDNFWINMSPKYASNDYHIHNGSHYSGCLYIQCEPNCGSIKINPNINSNTDWMDFLTEEYKNSYHIYPSSEFTPKEGMMLLFPSYLPHKVNNNMSNKERISIAFNITFS